MGCCHNFGLGVNWLHVLAENKNVLRKTDLPPMFKHGRNLKHTPFSGRGSRPQVSSDPV